MTWEEPTPPKRPPEPSCWEILWFAIKEKYPAERTPLIVSLILLMALPSTVLIVTGTNMRSACVEEHTACQKECVDSWTRRKAELTGAARYVQRDEQAKTRECYEECDAVSSICSTEVMLLFLGVGCLAGAGACGITMGMMIGSEDDKGVEEIHRPKPRKKPERSNFDKKRAEGEPDSPTSPKSPKSGGDPENPEEPEQLTEEERMHEREMKKAMRNTSKVVCPDCEQEFRTRLPYGNQRRMHVSPVVCPFCGYVVAGIL